VAVEADVALVGVGAEYGAGALPQVVHVAEFAAEVVDGLARGLQQLFDGGAAAGGRICTGTGVAFAGVHGDAAFIDFGEAVVQGVDQFLASLRVVQQVVLQIRIAAHHPDIAQHLVQHARGAAGLAGAAQLVEQLPAGFAQQADHDLAVGERGVVIGDFAQAGRRVVGEERVDVCWGVHGWDRFGLARRTTILAYCVAQRWAGGDSRRPRQQEYLHSRLSMQISFASRAALAPKISLGAISSESHAPPVSR